MSDIAYIVHQISGRVRLRIKTRRQDQAYFEALRRQLEPLECIETVRVNSNTGSIILRHSARPYVEW